MKRVLSYGGGLDSYAMLLRALELGERPDVVVFVDVADPEHADPGEWPSTYRHVAEVVAPLCAREAIPFEVVDSNRYPVRDARSLFAWLAARRQIPVAGPNRICTRIAKVERFEAWAAARFPGEAVETWIGFEAGEEDRAAKDPNAGEPQAGLVDNPELGWGFWKKSNKKTGAPSRFVRWFRRSNRFPLIDWRMCRCRCERYVRGLGLDVPRKSACVFCPYATRGDFQTLAREQPATFAQIVELEAVKPPTSNGAKLSIKNFRTITHADGSKEYRPTMLPDLVRGTYRKKPEPCTVCGAAVRATKATGCTYLEAA